MLPHKRKLVERSKLLQLTKKTLKFKIIIQKLYYISINNWHVTEILALHETSDNSRPYHKKFFRAPGEGLIRGGGAILQVIFCEHSKFNFPFTVLLWHHLQSIFGLFYSFTMQNFVLIVVCIEMWSFIALSLISPWHLPEYIN